MPLSSQVIRDMLEQVNTLGFAAHQMDEQSLGQLGEPLYKAINDITLHPSRDRYYNEMAFHWPEDWVDVEGGLLAFHDKDSLKYINSVKDAKNRLNETIGPELTQKVMNFASRIRSLVREHHYGLKNSELRLARVMVRQMGENDSTVHVGKDWHEDTGYPGRPYQQLLSVVMTTWGTPTEAVRYTPKVGELLMFNALDRRRLLGLPKDSAFIHRGPEKGPKMFFFFEFLGPRNDSAN